MISTRLVRQIEQNADKLAADLVQTVKQDVRGKSYHDLPDQKFQELVVDLYRNLGRWLHTRTWGALRNVYERKGRERYHDGMPLNNVVFSFTMTKCMLLDYIRGSIQGDASERDLELELILTISQFFDKVIYHIVTGYEDARQAALAHPGPTDADRLAERKQLVADHRSVPGDGEAAREFRLSRAGDLGEVSG